MDIQLSPEARDLLDVVLLAGVASLSVAINRNKVVDPNIARAAVQLGDTIRKAIADDQRKDH